MDRATESSGLRVLNHLFLSISNGKPNFSHPVFAISPYPTHVSHYPSTINGRIDQVNQVLELDHQKRGGAGYSALDKWTNQLNSLHQAIAGKLA